MTLPRWKQLLFGRQTVTGIREALRQVLLDQGIRLPYFRSYLIAITRIAFICFLAFLVFFKSLDFLVILPLLYGFYRLALRSLEGDGVIGCANRSLAEYLLTVE